MPRRSLDPRISVAVVYVAAQFMSIMDTTIVNVALPRLAREFDVAGTSIEWVVTGYLLSLAMFIPASGWLGDRFGTRRVFLFALGLFVFASALCGLARSFEQLVLFRALQGAGGGMLTPVGMAMLFRTFPQEQRVRASAILIIPTVVAPALGPVLGGVLVDQLSWRWVFYVNVPIGLAALIFGLLFLHEHRESAPGRFDLPGFLLAGSGFPLLLYALSEGPRHGWGSAKVLGTGIAGLLLLTAFVIVELRAPEPMVQLRLLGNRLFRSASTVAVMASGGFLGVLFLMPLFVQQARGQSALASGLTTFPEAVGILISSQVIARLYPRVGPRRLAAGGMLFVAAMMLLLTRVDLDTDTRVLQALMFLIGLGMACNFLPMQTAAFATITPSATGRASTLFNAQRQLGAALGVSVISTVLVAAGPTEVNATGGVQANVAAYHAAFLAAAIFALGAALLALTVSDRDAAPTMQRKRRDEAPAAGEVAVADD